MNSLKLLMPAFALLLAGTLPQTAAAQYTTDYCPNKTSGSTVLPEGDRRTVNMVINGACVANASSLSGGDNAALYVYHNVNIVSGGSLTFSDERIDFHAASIVVENDGTLTAGTPNRPIGTKANSRLIIYLWGGQNDPGAVCATDEFCGIPHAAGKDLWNSNPSMAMRMVPNQAMGCKSASSIDPDYKLPDDDCFYQYDIIDAQDRSAGTKAYFGHKVLALSYGGTLHLFGKKGAVYGTGADANPANTGISWTRLAGVTGNQITVALRQGQALNWQNGDQIIVTSTDYLPGHTETATVQSVSGNTVTLMAALRYPHNAAVYELPDTMPKNVGPRDDPNLPQIQGLGRVVDTRAAVGLLTRSIQITSEGPSPDVDQTPHDHFPANPGNFFGGHTIIRQGFSSYEVQGVEFWRLGQGGIIGHYPVHFHMARKTPQPANTRGPAVTYLKDSSIHESMTRWVTVHATQGVTLQRNVGYQSIGHGYYLEDATEVNNKLYANLGATAIGAVLQTKLNPREVPGILARPGDPAVGDLMPFRSDWNHPTIFWIMNGWNDFQYNMAVGATTCGACYWLLPAANSGPSTFEVWDGYASQGINRYGLSPLQNFKGNSCVSAMNAFQTVGNTNACLGVEDNGPTPPTNANVLPAVYNPTAPKENAPGADIYYPKLTGFRNPTICSKGDCSATAPCASVGPDKEGCMATVLDHFTTSFNYAQFNFAAIWLRPWWFLVTDSAITDSQYAGLNFVTGGGYTRADAPAGFWSLAYKSVFIGNSQKVVTNGTPANPFASNAGAFTPSTASASPDPVKCENNTFNYCLSKDNAVSVQLDPFGGQRMFSLYDGPSFQQDNAYLDIQPTTLTNCSPAGPGGGQCDTSGWMYGRVTGIPKDSSNTCYLPNAAIAWKQPNGFYYPPAFHSENLFFQNVNIRHFLIEPIFNPGTFITNPEKTFNRYCSFNTAQFNNFTDIDRQTVLNDGVPSANGGDGTLTGLIANDTPDKMPQRETISVNEDPFFNAPLETVECASDKHSTPLGVEPPGTAKTSPYEYVTTAMIAKCAIGFTPDNPRPPILHECVTNGLVNWTQDCGGPFCFGPQLYRQYLTIGEINTVPKPHPFIHMMGQGQGQRSTLTVNHGHYYLDTTPNCAAQGGCVAPRALPSHSVSVFQANQTYYVYFVYGRATTKQVYDIYFGTNANSTGNVTAQRAVLNDNNFVFNPESGSVPWLDVNTSLLGSQGIIRVTLDLTKSDIANELITEEQQKSVCQPVTYCGIKTKDTVEICGCKPGTNCKDDAVCSWGPKDPDCPEDGCYAFSFTMPGNFTPSNPALAAPAAVPFTSDPYFTSGSVKFTGATDAGAQCTYGNIPTQP